jgi:hypothetical protein
MARGWIVQPHEPIEKLEPNLWTVRGKIPGVPGFQRRMSIVRRADGSLVFYHAVPLEESAMAEIVAWGRPTTLVLGHDQHAVDAEPFAARLGLRVFGPARNLKRLRARGLDAAPLEEIERDPDVAFDQVDGTRTGDAFGTVRSGDRVSFLFADCIQNNPPDGVNVLFRWLGFTGGPRVSPPFRLLFTTDRQALATHLRRLADTSGLVRFAPFHGKVIDVDPAAALRTVAASVG